MQMQWMGEAQLGDALVNSIEKFILKQRNLLIGEDDMAKRHHSNRLENKS